jgi:Na+-transporting NADH:ubiquinone oxidoreductase subunit NqrC
VFRCRSLRGDLAVVRLLMRTLMFRCVAGLIAAGMLAGTAVAGKPIDQAREHQKQDNERAVFVTGSLIPQRIKLKSIGTTTVSPVRIIDRREIDATGRRTTRGVLIADPSVRSVGN